MTGIVQNWDRLGRYGKVTGFDRRAYFVHQNELIDLLHLAPGQHVEFSPSETERGPRALAVRPFEPKS
jgi:cold shock CspA family protein